MKPLRSTLNDLSLGELKASLRALYESSAHRNILAGIDTSLVLFDDYLINTSNGEYRQIVADATNSPPVQLAELACELLRGRDKPASILLLLPPDQFIATRFSMGISGEKLLRSALKLQAHTLLPAYEDELMLAINGQSPDGVALWFPAQQANAWFAAFQDAGLLLAAIMPRTLALLELAPPGSEQVLIDEDAQHATSIECRDGVMRSMLGIHQMDLQQPEFASQWQAESARLAEVPTLHSTGLAFWTALRRVVRGNENYSFFPAGAEQAGHDLIARKQRTFAAIAAGVVLLVLVLPFIANAIQIQRLESVAETLREESTLARQSQAAVLDMEAEWGALLDYPQQDVSEILLTLNELIDNSLTTFAIDKGVVDITGYAQDPAVLIEQLAQREEFYNVGQSRSSSGSNSTARGDRFGIRFNISNVDFPGYEEAYPPAQ